MRDFFINSLEFLVGVFVGLMVLGVSIIALGIAFNTSVGQNGPSGIGAGLAVFIGGILYVIFVGGFMYLGIGIYQNTKRSAEALEKMADKGLPLR